MQWPTKLGRRRILSRRGGGAIAGLWPERRADFGPDVVRDLDAAEQMLAVDSAITSRRLEYRAAIHERLVAEGIDLIVSPTQAFTPPTVGTLTVPSQARRRSTSRRPCAG